MHWHLLTLWIYTCAVFHFSLGLGFFFFFNDTATTEIYTLSLHDALPICPETRDRSCRRRAAVPRLLHRSPNGFAARRSGTQRWAARYSAAAPWREVEGLIRASAHDSRPNGRTRARRPSSAPPPRRHAVIR